MLEQTIAPVVLYQNPQNSIHISTIIFNISSSICRRGWGGWTSLIAVANAMQSIPIRLVINVGMIIAKIASSRIYQQE